jgi:hypothetical protein
VKHAFLIIAHNNWDQLCLLLQQIDAPNHDIYIHIDLKSTEVPTERIKNAVKQSALQIYRKFKIYWGGYSQVETELFLFEIAQKEHYDYYHLLSGADLLLVNKKIFDDFFEQNRGLEFIDYDDDTLEHNPEISRRAKYYHLLQNYRKRFRQKWKNTFFTTIERGLLVAQILLHVNRTKNLDWNIRYGSNWISITDDLIKTILGNKEKIYTTFHCTNCADELFVQTIAYNCGFKDKIYPNGNMRYIDWKRRQGGSPYTFRMADYDVIMSSKKLIARKFSEKVDQDVIQRVAESTRG